MVDFEYTDDLRDDEYPDELDCLGEMEDDATQTIICAACGDEVYEDSPQCPVCGHYITGHDRLRKNWWVPAIVVLLLFSFLLWMF